MKKKHGLLGIALPLFFYASALAFPCDQAPFSSATPESQGFSSESLKELAGVVQGYVEDRKIVGAELLVIKNRRTVLHEVFGWKDYEGDRKIPMDRNTIFNIRSMTKPVVGTAIQMLIDEGKLSLDDPVSKYLASFDNDKSRNITLEQLLTHTSGLPLGLMKGFFEHKNIWEVAAQAGEHGPDFEPGTGFQYSDPGTDTLGAVLAQVSGQTIEAFLQERILTPLGMKDTITLFERSDPRTKRMASLFTGAKGAWFKTWRPYNPMYPFAFGSQCLYSTPFDYARFLAFWMDGGVVEGKRLLSRQAVMRALNPVSDMEYLSGFSHLEIKYGQMWTLYLEPVKDGSNPTTPKPVLFGHNGSDGTHAWAWPGLDLMVLYFTQSRGQGTGIELESVIQRLLILPEDPGDPEEVGVELKAYQGRHAQRKNK